MAKDEKEIRDTARCIRTLLKTRGQTLTVKEITALIENSNLENPVALTQQISQDLSNRPTTTTRGVVTAKASKSTAIADWFIQNYDVIHACPEVEEGLLHLVTRGRVSKDEQERRRAALIARATGTDTDEETVTETTTEAPVTEPTTEFNF